LIDQSRTQTVISQKPTNLNKEKQKRAIKIYLPSKSEYHQTRTGKCLHVPNEQIINYNDKQAVSKFCMLLVINANTYDKL